MPPQITSMAGKWGHCRQGFEAAEEGVRIAAFDPEETPIASGVAAQKIPRAHAIQK